MKARSRVRRSPSRIAVWLSASAARAQLGDVVGVDPRRELTFAEPDRERLDVADRVGRAGALGAGRAAPRYASAITPTPIIATHVVYVWVCTPFIDSVACATPTTASSS